MRSSTIALVALVAAGCNAVFNLAETQPAPDASDGDVDDDTVADGDDNCPALANVDQLDTDGDGFGDVCDGCPTTGDQVPLRDEDRDGLLDACDNCPGQENRGQLDRDGDGIGDACDLLATPQRRSFFDGFDPLHADWRDAWPGGGGALTPTQVPSEMRLPTIAIRGTANRSWHVDARIELSSAPTPGRFGLRATNPTTLASFECGVLNRAPSPTGYFAYQGNVDAGNFVFGGPTVDLRMTLRRASNGDTGIECSWGVVSYTFYNSATLGEAQDVVLSLYAQAPETVTYVDVVQD